MKPISVTTAVIGFLKLVILGAGIAGIYAMPLQFHPVNVESIKNLLVPLFLIALFIERVVEVFMTPWRAGESERLEAENKTLELLEYKNVTRKLAFVTSFAAGIIVSALGIRALGPLLIASEIGHTQQGWLSLVDTLFTGAVLGGGSNGIHKLVKIFTTFMDATAEKAKGK